MEKVKGIKKIYLIMLLFGALIPKCVLEKSSPTQNIVKAMEDDVDSGFFDVFVPEKAVCDAYDQLRVALDSYKKYVTSNGKLPDNCKSKSEFYEYICNSINSYCSIVNKSVEEYKNKYNKDNVKDYEAGCELLEYHVKTLLGFESLLNKLKGLQDNISAEDNFENVNSLLIKNIFRDTDTYNSGVNYEDFLKVHSKDSDVDFNTYCNPVAFNCLFGKKNGNADVLRLFKELDVNYLEKEFDQLNKDYGEQNPLKDPGNLVGRAYVNLDSISPNITTDITKILNSINYFSYLNERCFDKIFNGLHKVYDKLGDMLGKWGSDKTNYLSIAKFVSAGLCQIMYSKFMVGEQRSLIPYALQFFGVFGGLFQQLKRLRLVWENNDLYTKCFARPLLKYISELDEEGIRRYAEMFVSNFKFLLYRKDIIDFELGENEIRGYKEIIGRFVEKVRGRCGGAHVNEPLSGYKKVELKFLNEVLPRLKEVIDDYDAKFDAELDRRVLFADYPGYDYLDSCELSTASKHDSKTFGDVFETVKCLKNDSFCVMEACKSIEVDDDDRGLVDLILGNYYNVYSMVGNNMFKSPSHYVDGGDLRRKFSYLIPYIKPGITEIDNFVDLYRDLSFSLISYVSNIFRICDCKFLDRYLLGILSLANIKNVDRDKDINQIEFTRLELSDYSGFPPEFSLK